MALGNECQTSMLDIAVNAAPVALDIHPRMLERMKLVALARERHAMLAELDSLIDSLGRISSPTGRFSMQADITQNFSNQLISAEFADSKTLVLLDQVKQHMADFMVDFAAFDPKTEFDRQSQGSASMSIVALIKNYEPKPAH